MCVSVEVQEYAIIGKLMLHDHCVCECVSASAEACVTFCVGLSVLVCTYGIER